MNLKKIKFIKSGFSIYERISDHVVIVTSTCPQWPLTSSRTAVESKSNRSCNHRITSGPAAGGECHITDSV